MSGFLRLETPRLILRDHTLADAESHHALLSDGRAMRYLPELRTTTAAQSLQNLQEAIDAIRERPRRHYFLRMELRQTGEHVGEIGYTVTKEAAEGRVVNLGYFLRPQMWRQGYATEGAKALLRYAFLQGGVRRVETGCLAENAGSEGVMKKCGMIPEGRLKEAILHEGVWKDRLLYRLLAGEWEE